MQKNDTIYIAWHRWLVWSAILRQLQSEGYTNILTKTREELDLCDQSQVASFFEKEKPDYVFLAAAKVGGIGSNASYPADFIYQNLQIQTNVLHQSFLHNVKKLLFLWSSCIYPKNCPQPIREEYLLSWPLEATNEPYAIAKIAWIKMCQSYNRQYGTNFIACMPTNLYGPGDNFDLETSHVLPGIMHRIHNAKEQKTDTVTLWGDGSPFREFLYVDDMANACLFLIQNFTPTREQNERWEIFFNIWAGKDCTVKELAELIKEIIWFKWTIFWDTSKPTWTPRKLLDTTRLESLGWKYKIELEKGIRATYAWFLENIKQNFSFF